MITSTAGRFRSGDAHITRRDWWLGIALIVAAVLCHAAFPRYEWRDPGGDHAAYIRIDRWTGRSQWGSFIPVAGHELGVWISEAARAEAATEAAARIEANSAARRRRVSDLDLKPPSRSLADIDALLAEADAALAKEAKRTPR